MIAISEGLTKSFLYKEKRLISTVNLGNFLQCNVFCAFLLQFSSVHKKKLFSNFVFFFK